MFVNHLAALRSTLQHKVPMAELAKQTLPQVPELKLYLLEESYPQAELTTEQIEWLMDDPPYWAFCWASGQVLARHLLDHPRLVANKTVIDFGCGSGVVAIAAKLAGARQCFAVDLDDSALLASQVNADLNQMDIFTHNDFFTISAPFQNSSDVLLLIADVFYDTANLPMLNRFLECFPNLLIADSRVKPEALSGLQQTHQYHSHTVPDLAEASDFNKVRLYQRQ